MNTTYRNDENIFGADCKIDGMKFGLSSPAADHMISEDGGNELDVREIIIQALKAEEWAEAISIEMQPKISRDGITAVIPTILRIVGRFKKVVTEKLNGY